MNVLQDHAATVEDRVSREEVAPLPAVENQRDMAVTMPRRLKDFEFEVAYWDAIAFPHFLRDLDRLEAVVRRVEPGRLGNVERNRPLVSCPQCRRSVNRRHNLDPEPLAEARGAAGMIHVIVGQ